MFKEEDSLRKGQNVAAWKTLLAGAVSGLLARSITAVSYTHLDVYKRQVDGCRSTVL